MPLEADALPSPRHCHAIAAPLPLATTQRPGHEHAQALPGQPLRAVMLTCGETTSTSSNSKATPAAAQTFASSVLLVPAGRGPAR